jgi:hypothetical protein
MDDVLTAQELLDLVRSLPKIPDRRTYTLEYINGDWVFRRRETELAFDLAMEEVFGVQPDPDDDRRFGSGFQSDWGCSSAHTMHHA